jgi:hypothetical protein
LPLLLLLNKPKIRSSLLLKILKTPLERKKKRPELNRLLMKRLLSKPNLKLNTSRRLSSISKLLRLKLKRLLMPRL